MFISVFLWLKIKKNRNEVIRTIQEITKFDEFTINEAIEACQDSEGRYSMDQVLNILMDEVYIYQFYWYFQLNILIFKIKITRNIQQNKIIKINRNLNIVVKQATIQVQMIQPNIFLEVLARLAQLRTDLLVIIMQTFTELRII